MRKKAEQYQNISNKVRQRKTSWFWVLWKGFSIEHLKSGKIPLKNNINTITTYALILPTPTQYRSLSLIHMQHPCKKAEATYMGWQLDEDLNVMNNIYPGSYVR